MPQTFGELLRHLRRKNGLTQSQLAVRLGYSRSMVAALETNRRLPQVDEIRANFTTALDLHNARESVDEMVELVLNARLPSARTPHLVPSYAQPRSLIANASESFRVPLQPTPLIGRERELQILCDQFLYNDMRLLTLVGPPGVGKTSLALATATRLQRYLHDGACLVSLASVTNPVVVPSAILDALGARQHGDSAMIDLVPFLRRKELLLLLDDLEQVLGAARDLADILSHCAGVRILVTSRERLHLRAEHVVQVQPLKIDDAVRLFVARATAINSSLIPTRLDDVVAQSICQRVDCLPLAIELCAAQADFSTPEQILGRLQTRPLDALVDGAVDMPPRHRTLRATIETSYQLLNEEERRLLRSLAVFVDGCTPEMVEQVWTDDIVGASQTSRHLRALAAKSLIQVEATPWGDSRVRMLESVREFALGKLEAEGETDMARARHFAAVSRHMRQSERQMWSTNSAVHVRRILQEQGNLFRALQWLHQGERWAEMASLLVILSSAFEHSARQDEFYQWYHVLLPHTASMSPDLAMMFKIGLCRRAYEPRLKEWRDAFLREYQQLTDQCRNPVAKAIAIFYGQELGVAYYDSLAVLHQAVELTQEGHTDEDFIFELGYGSSREETLPWAIMTYAGNLFYHGKGDEAEALMRESLRLRQQGHGSSMTCWSLGYLARIALSKGNLTEAVSLAESSVDHAVASGNLKGTATWRGFLGYIVLNTGDLIEARRILERAWMECTLFGDPFTSQITALFLSELALQEGTLDSARHWIAESMDLSARASRELGWRNVHRAMLAARLAACEGRNRRAAQLYGFMHAYSSCIRVGHTDLILDTAAPVMAQVRERMGNEAYLRAFEAGRLLPTEATLATLLDDVD